jgi:outer membrane protein assembly factor BamE
VASCSNTSIYNRTVTQGTVFKQDDIDRLEIGMSKDQVSFIMGQPSFQNIFDENVWDYYFQVKNGAQIQSEKKLKLLFDENGDLKEIKVIKI